MNKLGPTSPYYFSDIRPNSTSSSTSSSTTSYLILDSGKTPETASLAAEHNTSPQVGLFQQAEIPSSTISSETLTPVLHKRDTTISQPPFWYHQEKENSRTFSTDTSSIASLTTKETTQEPTVAPTETTPFRKETSLTDISSAKKTLSEQEIWQRYRHYSSQEISIRTEQKRIVERINSLQTNIDKKEKEINQLTELLKKEDLLLDQKRSFSWNLQRATSKKKGLLEEVKLLQIEITILKKEKEDHQNAKAFYQQAYQECTGIRIEQLSEEDFLKRYHEYRILRANEKDLKKKLEQCRPPEEILLQEFNQLKHKLKNYQKLAKTYPSEEKETERLKAIYQQQGIPLNLELSYQIAQAVQLSMANYEISYQTQGQITPNKLKSKIKELKQLVEQKQDHLQLKQLSSELYSELRTTQQRIQELTQAYPFLTYPSS